MADLEDALNTLLTDPDAMGQIMSLAGKLGLNGGAPDPNQEPQQDTTQPTDAGQVSPPPFFSPDQLGQLGRLMSLFQEGNDPQADALLTALRPYLRPARQEKLDRAMHLAGVSRAARQAYRLWKEGELHL